MQKHILLVEDDDLVTKAYLYYFKTQGFDVGLAKNTNIAKKMLRRNRPNVILLDLMLPGENGFKFLEKLKKNKKTKTIPVIIVSNLSQTFEIERCRELGASEYIVKSNFSMPEVVDRVERYI